MYDFAIGQLFVDKLHETKSEDAPISKVFAAYLEENAIEAPVLRRVTVRIWMFGNAVDEIV